MIGINKGNGGKVVMRIGEVRLKGYRNFKDTIIKFSEKTLVIGSNDIGKSNLLYALRILLDKGLSDLDIEPQDSDFYAYEPTNELSIIIKFEEVTEDCILSKFKGCVSDTGELYIAYKAARDPISGVKSYQFYSGCQIDKLEEISERYYRKVLNIKYIGSNRDLYTYIRKEKRNLIQIAKENRTPIETETDNVKLNEIESSLKTVNENITSLNFVKKATKSINNELKELSFHHSRQEVVFDIGASHTSKFIDNVQLASEVNGRSITIGGEGRNNQIFLALWAARNEVQEENPLEVVIYCIEEPEAHLHPHQQRKLAEYLYKVLKSQVIITSHSPQISSEFSPDSIIRLFEHEFATVAANGGCSERISDVMLEFGHRLNIISAEAFFASIVFLVEGASEVLFYKALAAETGVDLDRLNISILMVDGVGFEPYVKVLNELGIYWVMRTDNDIFKIPRKNLYRFAGVQRGLKMCLEFCNHDPETGEYLKQREELLHNFNNPIPPENTEAAEQIKSKLVEYDIYIATNDLEIDLFNSEINEDIKSFFTEFEGNYSDEEYIDLMKGKKATFMFEFLSMNHTCLTKLADSPLSIPLKACVKYVEKAPKRNES